jgi:glutathione S-transferase
VIVSIRSTRKCVNTPRVLMALEEAGVEYTVEAMQDGHFSARYGIPGPSMHDGTFELVETTAIMRHVARAWGAGTLWPAELERQAQVDRWLEFPRRVSEAVNKSDAAALARLVPRLDDQLADGREWIVGAFTIADCAYAPVVAARGKLPLDEARHLAAYLDRLAARPSLARAMARVLW